MTQDDRATVVSPAILVAVTGLFFLSGSASLVYQVIWMRALGLFFGSDLYGVTIILSTFMGGLALGSLFGGRFAERTPRPLMWYGACELGVAIFALCFASLLAALDPILSSFYASSTDATSLGYLTIRVVLASSTLLVPTALMGATLPLIMRHFVRSRSALGQQAAYFYGVNTLGALAGTLIAGFLLLPYFGMTGATWFTASINVLIAAVCIPLGLRSTLPEEITTIAPSEEPALDPIQGESAEDRMRLARAAILVFGLSGFGSFALEVVWTRILLISFSATVYSFAAMLSCFLFGIFAGSIWISGVVDRHKDPIGLFSILELGIGGCVGALCLLINVVPGFFGAVLGTIAGFLSGDKGGALVLATLATSFVLLVVPTTLLGATFAVALRTYTTNVARVGSRTGNLYFSNTFGAILGSLLGGLVLIPTFGTKASLAIIAVLFTINGLYLASVRRGLHAFLFKRASVAVPVLVAILGAGAGLFMPYHVALNFNQRAGAETELVYHAEGVQNTIDVVRSRSGVTSLIIGGNIEADDSYTQRRHFVLKGHLPLLMLDDPKSVLVVGLGMGITLSSTARHSELDRIDVIELSPEIVAAQSVLKDVNGDVTHNPLVHIRIDDGRSYVKMADRTYDMVTADPIHPKISRVGYLYTKEYYESIRARLNEGGVVCQWMPIYQISPTRLRSAMKSFAEVFPNATFWYVKNHGLFIAKRDSPMIDYGSLVKRFNEPSTRADLASIDINSPEELLSLLLLGPEEIKAYVNAEPDVPVNTDDYPYLEYFVPGDLFYRPADNVRELTRFLTDPTRFVTNQPPESVAEVHELIEGRAERLVEELE